MWIERPAAAGSLRLRPATSRPSRPFVRDQAESATTHLRAHDACRPLCPNDSSRGDPVADVEVVAVVGQAGRRARQVEKRDHLLRLKGRPAARGSRHCPVDDAAGLLVADHRDAADRADVHCAAVRVRGDASRPFRLSVGRRLSRRTVEWPDIKHETVTSPCASARESSTASTRGSIRPAATRRSLRRA